MRMMAMILYEVEALPIAMKTAELVGNGISMTTTRDRTTRILGQVTLTGTNTTMGTTQVRTRRAKRIVEALSTAKMGGGLRKVTAGTKEKEAGEITVAHSMVGQWSLAKKAMPTGLEGGATMTPCRTAKSVMRESRTVTDKMDMAEEGRCDGT